MSESIQMASSVLEKIKNVLLQEANLLKTAKEQLLKGTKSHRKAAEVDSHRGYMYV